MPLTWDKSKSSFANGPAIPNASPSVAAPTKPEFDALVGAVNALLQAARDAGLISAS